MRNRPEEPSTAEIQPWHSLGGIEHICELRKSCMVLYGIFTEIARLVYHDTDGRLKGTPMVRWSRGGTGIWIDSELRWEDEHPETRPAIYIQLGQIQRAPYIAGRNAQIEPADRFGERHYAHRVTGSVTFMHVAATVGEACSLADNTDYALSMMQDPICNDFCFTRFEATGRVPLEKLPKESGERYASGVMFSFEFCEEWDVKQECPILKSIDFIYEENEDVAFDVTLTGGKKRRMIRHRSNMEENKLISDDSKSDRHTTISRDNIFTEKEIPGGSR